MRTWFRFIEQPTVPVDILGHADHPSRAESAWVLAL